MTKDWQLERSANKKTAALKSSFIVLYLFGSACQDCACSIIFIMQSERPRTMSTKALFVLRKQGGRTLAGPGQGRGRASAHRGIVDLKVVT